MNCSAAQSTSWKALVSLSALYLTMSLSLSAMALRTDTISVPLFRGAPSIDPSIVDMRIGHSRLRIPRNYLETAVISENTGELLFILGTLFPGFSGASSNSIECLKSNWHDCTDSVIIYRETTGSAEQRHASILKGITSSKGESTDFGLIKYVGKILLVPSVYYVGVDAGENIVIECTNPQEKVPQHCRTYLDISKDITVVYQYNLNLLPQWKLVHAKVTELLNSFVVGDVP